jgi:hypothetical protein
MELAMLGLQSNFMVLVRKNAKLMEPVHAPLQQ